MKFICFVLAAALAYVIATTAGFAQVHQPAPCGPADRIEQLFESEFGMTPLIEFSLPNGVQSLLITNPDTGQWAHVVVSGPNWCIVAEGHDSGWWTPATY